MGDSTTPVVRFYVLNRVHDPVQRERFACELVFRGVERGLGHIHLQVSDPRQAERLDTLLWTFRKESFIPHALQTQAEDGETVIIGDQPEALSDDALLINLSPGVPSAWQAFRRVFEVVAQAPDVLEQTRAHFRHYQQAGVAPEKHDVNTW